MKCTNGVAWSGSAEPVDEWIIIVRQLTSTGTECYWDGQRYPAKVEAVSAGARWFGHDDFNVGRVIGNRLTWFGWMDQDLDQDRAGVARKLYLSAL